MAKPAIRAEGLHKAFGDHVVLDGVDHSFTGDGLGRMLSVVTPWLTRALSSRRHAPWCRARQEAGPAISSAP